MKQTHRAAFSLVELLVCIAIIALLIGLILPAVQKVRASSARLSCMNNLKQIGTALHAYASAHGKLPPIPEDNNGTYNKVSWMAIILPQMGEEPAYQMMLEAIKLDSNTMHNPPHTVLQHVVPAYRCPADSRLASPITAFDFTASYTSYIGNDGIVMPDAMKQSVGVLGCSDGIAFQEITDGTSNTIMVVERPPPYNFQAGVWYSSYWGNAHNFLGPNNGIIFGIKPFVQDPCIELKSVLGPGSLNNPCDRFHSWSLHMTGANALLADGSVKYFPYESESIFIMYLTRSGGEAIPPD